MSQKQPNPLPAISRKPAPPISGDALAGKSPAAAHTPGPWRITSLRRNGVTEHRVHFPGTVESTGTCVATVQPEDDYGAAALVAEANAKLIAAAPHLAESLLEMVSMMDCNDEHGAGSAWHIKARAAIKRAGL